MLCAISGEAPQVPVVSTKSGNVFEKRLIEAYIAENGKDPITGEEASAEDLVELKTARVVRPRPPTLTSIPSLLGVFQEEWDALALETYTLRQALVQTRQELSTALYQHDAAVRVIARLTKERDEARDTLSKISVGTARAPAGGDAMQVDSAKLPESVVAKIEETHAKLSKSRSKRPIPEGWATSDAIQSYKPTVSSEPLYPGGKSLSVDSTGDLALIGGVDGIAGVYSVSKQQIVQTLKVGAPVTDAVFAGSTAVVASSSGSVKFFDNGAETASFDAHAGETTAVVVHPAGDIVASVGVDKSYAIYDLATSSVVTQIYGNAGLLSAKFHPDGHLLAVGGADGQIHVYDVKSGAVAASFPMQAPVTNLEFSENGYFMAAVTENSTDISIWDLRKSKLHKVLETGTRISTLAWDYTGQFLLSGGPNGITVQQYTKSTKEWSESLRSAVPAVGVAWGPLAQTTPSRSEDVVDLTNEPDSPPLRSRRSNRPAHRHRPPRFGRNIMADVIDLEEEEDEDDGEDGQTEVINLDPPSSPEVQFVRETARPARRPPMFPAPSHLLDVINFHAQQGFLSTQEAFRQEIALQTRRMGRYPSTRPNMDEIFISSDGNRNIDVPIDLDYQAPGFTIHESQPTPPPSYKPPSPPPEGFTRTVSEDDVVIWVAKQCGHVYCGECTTNRAMSSKKKTATLSTTLKMTKPFSKCKVAGCEKPVSAPKSMIQVYL
ncbi:uncharacterized protein BHQ10_005684 [Talaromyces amestolkiae]|uniref:Pre-mRNA-processing factor 19 n=1 Tax=Talaromyces amestolkiae TaxID=1196081 RepID=A0A364L1I1_TALAM|nr:uncharacterized protein BHQ10_005684 [Talaromyces amestolkiae]RAO69672.1 hypothetical protein BHQ10_005684 [Talaromyces amestolkiae]